MIVQYYEFILAGCFIYFGRKHGRLYLPHSPDNFVCKIGIALDNDAEKLADRVGFEPTAGLHPRWFSRPEP